MSFHSLSAGHVSLGLGRDSIYAILHMQRPCFRLVHIFSLDCQTHLVGNLEYVSVLASSWILFVFIHSVNIVFV